jgi:hypothetical protein
MDNNWTELNNNKLATSAKAADSEKLDGYDSSKFARKVSANTFAGNITISNNAPQLIWQEADNGKNWISVADGTSWNIREDSTGSSPYPLQIMNGGQLRSNGNQVLTTGTKTTLWTGNMGGATDIPISEDWDTFDYLVIYMSNDDSSYGTTVDIRVSDLIASASLHSNNYLINTHTLYWWIYTTNKTVIDTRVENSRFKAIYGVRY